MWDFRPERGRLYVATFAPKRKRRLFKEAKKFVNKDLYVTPVFLIDQTEYDGQWAFRSNEMSLLILEQDLIYVKEITEPLEKTTPDKGQE